MTAMKNQYLAFSLMMITNGVVEGNITVNIKMLTDCLTVYRHDNTVKLSGNM
jgi:hypothetical protein